MNKPAMILPLSARIIPFLKRGARAIATRGLRQRINASSLPMSVDDDDDDDDAAAAAAAAADGGGTACISA